MRRSKLLLGATVAMMTTVTAAGASTWAGATSPEPSVFGGEIHLEDEGDQGEPVRSAAHAAALTPTSSTCTSAPTPPAWSSARFVYEGLVSQFRGDPAGARRVVGASDDGLEYTFTLREGATFHSGRGDRRRRRKCSSG